MEWFTNLLNSSWLSDVELFGLNGWWLLLIGSGFWIVVMTILAILSNARANRAQATGNIALANRARAHRSLFVSLAIFVPVIVLCALAWPIFWLIPAGALVVGVIILGVLFVKAARFMIGIAIGLVLLLLFLMIMVMFGGNPFAPKICLDDQGQPVASHSFTLDVEGGQFGPAMPMEQQPFIDEMMARVCQDKALLAAVNVSKEGDGAVPQINQAQAQFAVSQAEWYEAATEFKQFMEESTFVIEDVPAGTPTLYMVVLPNGEIEVKHGSTVNDGHVAVFTHPDGRVLKLRIECGAQPTFDVPPDLPPCEEGECPEPVCPTNPALPPDSPDCLQSKDPKVDKDEDGWTQLPSGDLTTGNESEEQQESGDVSGNVTDNTVDADTNTGDTTTDLEGDVGAVDADEGGDDVEDDTVDDTVTNQDDGGTDGDTEIEEPAD
jgi:hypothetical protein